MTPEKITLELARRKMDTGPSDGKIHRPRLGTGGNFGDVFFWDTAFTCLWAKHFAHELPVLTSLDNLYRLADQDGYIARQHLPSGEPKYLRSHPKSYAPPVLAWAELDLYDLYGDLARLRAVYPVLQRFHDSFHTLFRAPDGLFFSDPLGCGMDNLPRWPRGWAGDQTGQPFTVDDIHPSVPGREDIVRERARICSWNRQGRWIDASAQAAFDALCMQRMARLLGDEPAAARYASEHQKLKNLINERCWSEADAFYFDLAEGQQIRRLHIGAWWTLIAEVCPPERLERFTAHLTDPRTFGVVTPVPSLSADDPDFRATGDYWLGSSWAPTTYMVLRGLKANGLDGLARQLGSDFLATVVAVLEETGTLWENYAPSSRAQGRIAQPDFVGWTGLATVAIPREILAN